MSAHDHHRSAEDETMDDPPASAVRRQRALDQASFWHEASRSLARAQPCMTPPIRFFSPDEARLMEALCAQVLPQDDRDATCRIPVVPFLDERLHLGRMDPHQAHAEAFAGVSSPAEAYHLGLRGVDALAELLHDRSFVDLGSAAQAEVLKILQGGDPPRSLEAWARMPPHRFWHMIVRDLLEVYYAHPFARATLAPFMAPRTALAADEAPEPWEIEQARCAWEAPLSSPPRGAKIRAAAWKRSG